MFIHTDVLGSDKAYKTIENAGNFFISVVTYMELVQGMRNKKGTKQPQKSNPWLEHQGNLYNRRDIGKGIVFC